jgi:F-type H+-transporting ATPase subunit epsilon
MADTFKLKIISPDRVFFEGEVEELVLKGIEGEFAILPNHMPMTTVLGIGNIGIYTNNKKDIRHGVIHGGFATIFPYETVILANATEWPEEIDLERAQKAKERAERRLKETSYNRTRARASLHRALARITGAKVLLHK